MSGKWFCCWMAFLTSIIRHNEYISDINECERRIDNCNKTYTYCKNTIGSYSCSCKTGFEPWSNDCRGQHIYYLIISLIWRSTCYSFKMLSCWDVVFQISTNVTEILTNVLHTPHAQTRGVHTTVLVGLALKEMVEFAMVWLTVLRPYYKKELDELANISSCLVPYVTIYWKAVWSVFLIFS